MSLKGLLFKYQRHSLHDGPGIRTLVFLKGCPMRCLWCFNPESQNLSEEVIHYPEKCLGCTLCLKACPIPGALKERDGKKAIDRQRCNHCGRCAEVCVTGAMTRIGTWVASDDVLGVVQKDKVFYHKSGGGVTLSGGEVTFQEPFACEILLKCKAQGIHTVIETSGCSQWDSLRSLLHYTDLVFYDLKVIDAGKHAAFTGVDNAVILENAKRIARLGVPMIIRIPIIPGYTDSRCDLKQAAEFIASELTDIAGVHLLPYETVGVAKYERLGREYALKEIIPPANGFLTDIQAMFERYGLKVQIGG
jgi:pyruvate formate lyase activating enzyme